VRASHASELANSYDGERADALAARLAVPVLRIYAYAPSTMDLAHTAAAAGAPAGTVIVADVQTAGRGRSGRRWVSEAGAGVWATVVARPRDVDALSVLSLRVGIALATELQPFVGSPIALKWPNDLLLAGRKLAGVLVEARWREGTPEWVAVGVGVNRRPPAELADAIGTGDAVSRREILGAVVRAVRRAADATGVLHPGELAQFAARDAVRGREVLSPVRGHADGVSARGELLVRAAGGDVHPIPTATVQYGALPA